ncbi:MAG: DUF998 domain-containing protein [Halapricum sp.]
MTETVSHGITLGETSAGTRRRADLCFLALAAQFVIVITLAAAIAPDYDFGASAISDLGVIPETALLFNGSLLLVGTLNVLGGYLFYRSHGSRWLLATYVLTGVGSAGAALFPLDSGGLHGLFALVAFLFANGQAIGTATQVRGAMRPISILAGVIGLAFVVLMVIGDSGTTAAFGPIGHGGAERMIVYPAMLWLVAFGGYLLGQDAEVRP